MSGHRRYRSRRSSESSSSGSWSGDVHGGHRRRLKRSSDSLPVRRSPASHHSWVLLNRSGAQRDGFPGDRTTSAMSRTSRGEEISVSFELVDPPGTSVLTVDDCPRSPSATTPRKSDVAGCVVAAHRDTVLLAITSYDDNTPGPWMDQFDSVTDLFVYRATRDSDPSGRRWPSLSLLPSAVGLVGDEVPGVMSCTRNGVDGGFVVAASELEMRPGKKGTNVRLFRSESGQWESFDNLHVRGANGGRDLRWWSTDAVVPYGRRCMMIWVDYYRGMVLTDLSSPSSEMTTSPPPPPRLRYVPLPVDRVDHDPDDIKLGRGCPNGSRRVCVTRYGIKFVSIDSQHWSNFGVGHHKVLKWSHRFRITTWSLREHDDGDYTWRRDTTMHEREFWDAFDGGDRFPFPHVQPSFPVVDMDNPDVVVFRIEKPGYCDHDELKWTIEVDLRKKVLLAATAYSKKGSDPIPSELPRHLDGGQACKRRRQ